MNKTKKGQILFFVLFTIVCSAVSLITILSYINNQPSKYEQTVLGLIDDEKIHDVKSLDCKYNVQYLLDDGTKSDALNADIDYEFDSWD
jgi:ABC-type lipoprotein release transport system permease subunit